MSKELHETPLFTSQDLLVNGIMRQPLIHYPPSVNPLSRIPGTEIMTVIGTQGPVAIKDNYPLPARDFVGIEIPGTSPPIKALTTANIAPQFILEHELHDHLKLDPKRDYTLIGVQDLHDAKAFSRGVASRYLLLVNKGAYRKMAIEALNDLADPHLGALLTHPDKMEGCHKVVVPERPFATVLHPQHELIGSNARNYCEEIKDPNSAVSKLIDQIMQQAEIPNLDAKKVVAAAAERNNFEMAGRVSEILRGKSPSFTTHIIDRRNAGDERTPS